MIHFLPWQLFDVKKTTYDQKTKVDQQLPLRYLIYCLEACCRTNSQQIALLFIMGNSNIETEHSHQSITSQASVKILQVFYHNELFGRHTLSADSAESVLKVYLPASPQQQLQLRNLIKSYQCVQHCSAIALLHVREFQENGKTRFDLQFEKCQDNLKDEIAKKIGGYREEEIIEMISSLTEALKAIKQAQLPLGLLTSAKIGLCGHQKPYCLTSDHLMNPELYEKKGQVAHASCRLSLAPEEVKNPQMLLNRHQKSLVFSLGLVALQMILRETVSCERITKALVELRHAYSFQLSKLLEGMLSIEIDRRFSFEGLSEVVREYWAKLARGVIRRGESALKRGYNCLESQFFLVQEVIDPAGRARLLKRGK